MKKNLRRFIADLISFGVFILILQSGIFYIFNDDVPSEILTFKKNLKSGIQIIYFGDSVSEFISTKDLNKRTIPQLIQQNLPGVRIGTVIQGGYNMNVFLNYSKLIAKSSKPPKIVIIPINFRTFSPIWYKNPPFLFTKEVLFLNFDGLPVDIVYKPLVFFKIIDLLERQQLKEFNNSKIYNVDNVVGKLADFTKDDYGKSADEKMRNKIIVNYMFKLSQEHKLINSMQNLSQLLNTKNVKVVFYITPVDYKTAEQYWGSSFKNNLEENVKFLKKIAKENNADLLDLSQDLDTTNFGWQEETYINEHLNEKGRIFVAEAVTNFIGKKYLKTKIN